MIHSWLFARHIAFLWLYIRATFAGGGGEGIDEHDPSPESRQGDRRAGNWACLGNLVALLGQTVAPVPP